MVSRYRYLGITLECDSPLVTNLSSTSEANVDLRFSVVDSSPTTDSWVAQTSSREGSVEVGRLGDDPAMHFPLVGYARFQTDIDVVFHLTHPENRSYVESALLGPITAYWLERRGVTALHGSAVAAHGYAIGFIGPRGAGKTSIALSLVDRGLRLLTDDLLAINTAPEPPLAYPAFPEVRLWPSEAQDWVGASDELGKVHPDREKLRVPLSNEQFQDNPIPIVALYARLPTEFSDHGIQRASSHSVLFRLMLDSFVGSLLDAPSTRADWIGRLGRLLDQVPVYSIGPISEKDRLPNLAGQVLDHARSVAAESL